MKSTGIGRTLDEAIAELPAAQRRAIDKRASELIAEEASLRELRKALGLTQVEVARALNKGQHEISRIEQRGDMLLSTLTSFVAAMGGELELICRFKKRAPVRVIPRHVNKASTRGASEERGKGRRPAT